MRYQYVFTDWFNRNLKALGKRNPVLRQDLEDFLTTFDAEAHPVIPRTGGARKARMSHSRSESKLFEMIDSGRIAIKL